jgi:hypothetical protein
VSHEVADRLAARGIPVVFSTGSTDVVLPERLQKYPLINKPFADQTLRQIVESLLVAQAAVAFEGPSA